VKANVLFFDKRPASKEAQTKELWVYDYRTNIHKTLKTKPLASSDLNDFVDCFHKREETERFRRFSYDELIERDKLNLDIFWLKDDSLEDIDSLPEPEVLAQEIVDNLEAALQHFRGVSEELSEADEIEASA
jgi:type I restriction enzyme M protein